MTLTSTPTSTSTAATATRVTTTPTASPTPLAVAAAATVTNTVPFSSNTKFVWAHHIVGNTYPYTYNTWLSDMSLAMAGGIDGFALNMGTDSWQSARIADAYNAAQSCGFKVGEKRVIPADSSSC